MENVFETLGKAIGNLRTEQQKAVEVKTIERQLAEDFIKRLPNMFEKDDRWYMTDEITKLLDFHTAKLAEAKITAVLRDPLIIDGVILACNHCHTRGMIDDNLKCLNCGETVESDDAYYEGEKWYDEATMKGY